MHVIFHHAAHDIPILAELFGISSDDLLRHITFDDTMVMSYVLRLLPLGLKPLERRYNGRPRESYPEIVGPADRQIAIDYLRRLLTYKCDACAGDGSIIVSPIGAKGRQLPPRPVKCEECEGDGLTWPAPDEEIEFKGGRVVVKRGRRIGYRIRKALARFDNDDDGESEIESDDEAPPAIDVADDDGDDEDGAEERKPRGLRLWWTKDIAYSLRMRIEDVAGPMPEVTLDDVDPQPKAVSYSAADADGTLRLYPVLKRELESNDQWRIYEIDRNTLPLLVRMMEVGTYVDVPYLNALDARLEVESDQLMYQLQQEVGRYVNPASSKQVAELLFDDLRLPIVRETKTGDPSTQDKVLEDLKLQIAARPSSRANDRILRILGHITDTRERTKLRGTYTQALPRCVDKNSRIHTTFNAARTDTNRLSSTQPNLQNVPARTVLGLLIRGAFSAPDGYVLVGADYSQIEVRVIAHASGDRALIKGIRAGVDVHYITASRIFRLSIEQVSKQQRMISKRITFLILYGGGAERLRAELKLEGIEVTIEEAQGYIDAYLTIAYPGIHDYMLSQVEHARRYGYVEDMFGWRRYLPGVHSAIEGVRSEAERMSVNAPIQSGAAGVMRLACPVIYNDVLSAIRKTHDCDPLLTVHDEFLFQVRRGGEEKLKGMVEEAMKGVVKLKVPIEVEGKVGMRWTELK